MKSIEVVAAVIVKENKVLCCKRGPGRDLEGYYEFPGGKIEINETKEEALIREIKEELNIDISIDSYITTIEHDYSSFHLIMYVYRCIIINGDISLNEHTDSIWCNVNELKNINFASADLEVSNYIFIMKNV